MAVFLLLSIALIFLFVGFIAITYFIASFINEVILKRSDNPKLYITIGFIISFMLFLLFSPLQHLAAMDANVFLACVLLLGVCMIFSIAYLMQQKYRARISDDVRIIIGMIATGVLMFMFSSFSGTPLSNWSGSISDPITISPLRHAIENCLIVAVGVWTFIGLKSKYWRAFAGYLLFVYSIFCLNWIASSIAIKISSDPLFLAELSIKGMFFLMCALIGLFPFILLLVGIYIADKMGFIKRVKEYLTSAVIRILDEVAGRLKRDHEEPGRGKKYASVGPDPYYYSVLGVSKNATREEIKDAYYRLAKIYHPDVSADPDAEKKSKEIHKAYEVLSDPDRRAQYDRFEDSYNE